MNGSLVFVIIVITIVMSAQLAKTWIRERSAKLPNDDELQATLARLEKLEERVVVLERIITENRFDLKREIDSL